MPAYTYITEQEAVTAMRTLPDHDAELAELLNKVRSATGDEWIVRVYQFTVSRGWFRKPERQTRFSLYWFTGAGIEWQAINLRTSDGGSVFGGSAKESAAHVSNFLMGILNGMQRAALAEQQP